MFPIFALYLSPSRCKVYPQNVLRNCLSSFYILFCLGLDVQNVRILIVNTISVTYIYKCDNNMEHVLNNDVWNISLHYYTQQNDLNVEILILQLLCYYIMVHKEKVFKRFFLISLLLFVSFLDCTCT